MKAHGLHDELAYGRARWDAEWRAALYDAQMIGRDPSLKHGKAWTYAHHRCRCPECRATQPGCKGADVRELPNAA
ncbi:hypothetical protein [Streptosporangium sandarakinum]|uniref:hypothetical protein n=1 Tax=Streptosporangium sandarakinum TaxID=1260955 RepID=UPI0036843197